MIVLRPSSSLKNPRVRGLAVVVTGVLLAALGGCRTPGALPRRSALEPLEHRSVLVPNVADRTAAEVAAAALASNRKD